MPPSSLDASKIDFQKYYFYGTILNIPPILIMYPMRTVRLLQQRKSSTPVSSSIFKVIKDVKKNNGVRALYAGATVFSVGLTSAKILQFATYDYLAQVFKENDHFGIQAIKNPAVLGGVLGTSSAIITTFIAVPFDVVSQHITLGKAGVPGVAAASTITTPATSVAPRIVLPPTTGTAAASSMPIHVSGSRVPLQPLQPMSISDSLKLQIKHEGARFLFRGYVATLLSAIPFFAAYFPAYEMSKVWVKDGIQYVRSLQPDKENPIPPSELHQLIISTVAGSLASFAGVIVSSPSDMVKTRIQTENRLQPTNGTGVKLPMPSLKWIDVFTEIWRKEGFLKFFAGTKARAILAVPGGALNFIIFDFVRSVSAIKEPSLSMKQLPIPAETMDGLL